MTNIEKKQAIALLEDMAAHGYHLMQYHTAQDLVDTYSCLPLSWWQETHDKFMEVKKV